MKLFTNRTTSGNEEAIRRGQVVPAGGVNLAWAQSPQLTPDKNVIIVDTSRIVDQNTNNLSSTGAYYANTMGVLEDITGNHLFQDQFPAVSDEFSISGDLTNVDFSAEHILTFVHVSRHFHIDSLGLTMGTGLTTFTTGSIKVVDDKGRAYVDANGAPRFKIKICPAYVNAQLGSQAAYRVWAYVDTNTQENLYLTYDKIEIRSDGSYENQVINYQELLNPQPVFQYRPENTEVVDLNNREQKWYSTRSISLKDQALGLPVGNVNGFKIYVPFKALNDPRTFQLFRWRVTCNFTDAFTVGTRIDHPLNCGVIVTTLDPTSAVAQVFNNLQSVDTNEIVFTNPINTGQSGQDQITDTYWYVNFDTVTYSQLAQFDLLVWAPNSPSMDFANYLGKIKYFTETLGKILLIDTENHMVPKNLGINTTGGVSPTTGTQSSAGTIGAAVTGPAYQIDGTFPGLYANVTAQNPGLVLPSDGQPAFSGVLYNRTGEFSLAPTDTAAGQTSFPTNFSFFDGSNVNGWRINNTDPISELQTNFGYAGGFTQYMTSIPGGAIPLVQAMKVTLRTYTQPVVIPSKIYTLTWYTSQTQFFNLPGVNVFSSLPPRTQDEIGLFGDPTGNELLARAPAVPTNGILDRVEVYQETLWLSGGGSNIITWLNGPGFNAVSHVGSVPVSLPGAYGALNVFDKTQDPLAPGGQFQLSWGVLTNGDLHSTTLNQQMIRATTYYHVTTRTPHTAIITPTSVYTYTVPTYTPVPVVIQKGNLIFSTFNLLSSAVNGIAGAQEFLYNVALYATSNRPLSNFEGKAYASSFSFSSPWTLSWVINTTDNPGVLSDAEKVKYNFVFAPEDIATPTPVWQRQLSASTCKQLIDSNLPAGMADKVAASTRSYSIEVTNSNVQVPTTLSDSVIPSAWTEAYSAPFIIPADFPSYIIREKEVVGNYEAGQFVSRSYPDKPYNLQAHSIYDSIFDFSTNYTVSWSASGTAVETYITDSPPPSPVVPITTPGWQQPTEEIELTWWNNTARGYSIEQYPPYFGASEPTGIVSWQEVNYNNSSFGVGQLNWPFFGLTGRYQGENEITDAEPSTGDVVKFIQDFLNTVNYFTVNNIGSSTYKLPGGWLSIDGVYGSQTKRAVIAFQQNMHARFVDGVVDAETWALIGGQVLRFNIHSQGHSWQQYYEWVYSHIKKEAISDGSMSSFYAKRSNSVNGPSVIWDIYAVIFDKAYNIHAISFTPYVEGSARTMIFDAVDVRNNWSPASLLNFNPENMLIKHMNKRVPDAQKTTIPFPTVAGNCVLVGIGQDQTSFPTSSRMFGIREISASATIPAGTVHATNTTLKATSTAAITSTLSSQIASYRPTVQWRPMSQRTIEITAHGTASVTTGRPTVIQAYSTYHSTGSITGMNWRTITVDNPNVTASITASGMITLIDDATIIEGTSGIVSGQALPGAGSFAYYSLDGNGNRRPYPETGWISKADGLKLLCDIHGAPVGFPTLPTAVGSGEQRHYVNLTLTSSGTESTVQVGFYDKARHEFVVNSLGQPEMPYVEYISRGANNIYVGVISTYELDTAQSLPVYQPANSGVTPRSDDAPMLPNIVAMPVYGVTTRPGNKISLEPLPSNLGPNDIWPVPVRTGQFNRQILIPAGITTYISSYQNTIVTAFYSIPEADLSGWSSLFGAPNVDVVGEQPLIVDDNIVQVRQAPILMVQEPTLNPGPADPVRPIFQLYQRSSVTASWVPITFDQISDYNTSTGEIYLASPMTMNDPTLFKVDYTTQQRNYYFKQYDGRKLNLNPYPGQSRDLLGQSIYIYIVPQYVLDTNNQRIASSVQTRTLRFTTDPSIFNPTLPSYDPLAFQLGIVYMAPAVDINDLILLDTRRRGGGAADDLLPPEVQSLISEASSYWDLNYGAGMSYQKGGFVIVRLPVELKQVYTETFIREVIERNLTIGVQYKLEDLSGNDW